MKGSLTSNSGEPGPDAKIPVIASRAVPTSSLEGRRSTTELQGPLYAPRLSWRALRRLGFD